MNCKTLARIQAIGVHASDKLADNGRTASEWLDDLESSMDARKATVDSRPRQAGEALHGPSFEMTGARHDDRDGPECAGKLEGGE